MFSEQQLKIIQYSATECEHQGSGELSVYDMVNAWKFASVVSNRVDSGTTIENLLTYHPNIDLEFILSLGALVEPAENRDGFRTHAVGIVDPNSPTGIKPIGSSWWDIERHLTALLDSFYSAPLTPDEFYKMYEEIHPFRDGNGRTGKILYNYLCGTLENPIWPPNFFGGEHP